MSNWQQELAQGFANSKTLLEYLNIDSRYFSECAEQSFRTKVPLGFAERMQKGNINDPLLRQVLAQEQEMVNVAGYVHDPLLERQYNPIPGLIHKYPSRVLLILSGACAVHCRYCFRRHFPYEENRPGTAGLQDITEYLSAHPEINEVILSGGDPLLLNNHYFATILSELAKCTQIRILRIHSRIPIVLPSRIESSWLALFEQYPWHKVMVVHANHANELDQRVNFAVQQLKTAGWTVLNQSVLLAGVNDQLDVLVNLSYRLFEYAILPYYLHVLDPVAGAAHFNIPQELSLQLYRQLQARLPGYLLPRLVQEQAGELHKTLLGLS